MTGDLDWGDETRAADGLSEREFALVVDGERVPGVLWCLPDAGSARPLVMAGHGFMLDRHFPFPLPSVRALASEHGCAVAVLDAPCHGDRRRDVTQPAEQTAEDYQAYWGKFAGSRVAREYAESAAALRQLPELQGGTLGYWGLSLATQYGLGWLSELPAVRAAVLGLFGGGRVVAHYASRVRCPVFFVQQLDDEIHSRETVAKLFDAIAAEDKQLAANPGLHVEVPDRAIRTATRFLVDRLRDGVLDA